MYKPLLFASLFLTPVSLHALDTRQTPTEHLLELGRALAAHAGSSQWQQLWQRVRQAGYLQAHAAPVHFSVPTARLPDLARQTLAQADQVQALRQTQALYRRTFAGQVIGQRNGQPLHALCLLVDWRTLPQGMHATPQAYLSSASLLSSYPCE
ncbi:hypothetical protein PPUJ20028_09110 [Pseudomonas putida]|uniref:Secreted protein n=1 Tax=Pseudomonas putida TaxID=303 RepID=A0AA37RBC2_PSEPU|nr:hypothetical protein [Pseudomonas putida]GLO12330.1 hypothetical protein PPUJ20028_09110 [Pseudomonas putida]GLO35287.1 hypothetical protein PPUN14671_21200 [Pseudomonas putida]HDS0963037.1 hypothetical protein [Pseudomonas putida]HDS0990271.1 hypothetical protein [Pseudomonas putida]